MRRFFASTLEVLEVALIAVISVFLVRTFLVQPFLVSGASMIPSFQDGDYLLVDELTYRFRPPLRGEVGVFRYPDNKSTYFIKRFIGLPGERIQIKDGQVIIFNDQNPKGVVLSELYLPIGLVTGGEVTLDLKPSQYFVLGDNRSSSFDSRSWGILEARGIVGLARLRLWPLDSLKAFAAPTY